MRKPSRVKLEKKEKNQLRNAIGSANLFNFNFFLLRQWLEQGKKGKKAKPSQNISKGNNSVENKKKLIIDWGPKFCSLSQQKCAGRAGDVLGLFPSTGLLYLWPRRLREMLSAGALFLSEVIFRKFTCDDEANAKRLSFFPSPPFVNERKNKKWREFSFFFLRGHLENGEKGMTEKMRARKNRAQKMGAFYVEFIFHAWLARDFAFSVVGPHQWVAIASKFNSAFVRNCYFFFLDLFSKKITLNFFYYLKCPPAPNAQDLVLPFTFFCFLFTEKENEKIHFQFLFFFVLWII